MMLDAFRADLVRPIRPGREPVLTPTTKEP